MKSINISDEAYDVILTHAHTFNESTVKAVDELIYGCDHVWDTEDIHMIEPVKRFEMYHKKRYNY